MTSLLQQLDIFELCPLITNLNCKLSTVSPFNTHQQLLCLVSEENEIILRYTDDSGQEVLKLISWFRKTHRVIHDVCFDPSGTWLLVLCFDNTLHIVPALAIVDPKKYPKPTEGLIQHHLYSIKQITSYIIPFVGPHECPNSKKCPNNNANQIPSQSFLPQKQTSETKEKTTEKPDVVENLENEEPEAEQQLKPSSDENEDKSQNVNVNANVNVNISQASNENEADVATFSHDLPPHMLASNSPPNQNEDKTGNSHVMATSFMASNTCPYPLSVVWWQTLDGVNRAVVGYSDGSICFVGLSPNCPFVANTSIETGSVVKLLICRDNTFDSVLLLITSSLKRQYKLLLEQKAIRYIYPGEMSPSNNLKERESDWQIVMPLKRPSNNSDPASDNSTLEEEVFAKNSENQSKSNGPRTTPPPSYPSSSTASITQLQIINSLNSSNSNQMPPPPPYSVAINRHLINNTDAITTQALNNIGTSVTNTSGVRFQQRQIPDLPSSTQDTDSGILPAARARLASLKSLGSKKLNAIKMRLSDNRQKLEEYLPENQFSSFAILDSPSVTPEPLVNTVGSFFTIQNLRSTYLLSALHSHSNSLSVHNVDIQLTPVFLYKIPNHCVDILISSNLLYSIQYVDIRTDSFDNDHISTEKEKRDIDTEKMEKDLIEESENKAANLCHVEKPSEAKKEIEIQSSKSSSTDASNASSSKTNGSRSESSDSASASNSINAVGVISSALASIRTRDEQKFNPQSQLALMRFENETVLNLYQMASFPKTQPNPETITKEEKDKAFAIKEVRSPMDYVKFYETNSRPDDDFSIRQLEIMVNGIPKIKYDPCYVITNKNVYYLQLKKEPFAIFLDAALNNNWEACKEFCTTFDLNFEAWVEYAGDYLLRRHKVTQALFTYNTARVKPIRTALKLAMFGQTNALLHLCAMALKITYLLKSKYFSHPILKTMLQDISFRHAEDVRNILPIPPSKYDKTIVNEGQHCSDYRYGVDESISSLQMTPSSQFHLANLLLITLAEKAVNDKNYIPLWNFLVTNTKYHTNMTSIVLCQSGLYSAALILAKTRGVCIDTFLAMTSVLAQEFGLYNELNVCLFNLCESFYIETITYLPNISIDYFGFIQEKLSLIRPSVLKLLAIQLNPFSAKLRPIVSHSSNGGNLIENNNENSSCNLYEFCKNLIETYLAVLIRMDCLLNNHDQIKNAFSHFRINYEDQQFAIDSTRFKPISAGCAHCACVIDGIGYFWGSNGVPCTYSVNKSSDPPEPPYAVKTLELLTQLNLKVHGIKCGRQHSLILTNNGVYAFGNNNLGQLGIGKHMLMSLQPMLITALDGKNITILEAGQYHNAAVANGVLYTWGWGVYGQLGHGDTENSYQPKVVQFFKNKKVLQVSLGHGHSLVLCEGSKGFNELYVFGSNHFGQLGLGSNATNIDPTCRPLIIESSSHPRELKSLLPVQLDVSEARIRLIHTKFFTNLVVDEDNRVYTWGSSPQALRLANQIKKRAMAKQKQEEHQRNEMTKRFAATLNISNDEQSSENFSSTSEGVCENKINDNNPEFKEKVEAVAQIAQLSVDNNIPLSSAVETLNVLPGVVESLADANVAEVVLPLDPEIIVETVPILSPNPSSDTILEQKDLNIEVSEVRSSSIPLPSSSSNASDNSQQQNQQINIMPEPDLTAHLSPQPVDTSEIAGNIMQISCGMFHFALITSTCTLYTWGKNLEHQLGTADKERRPLSKPMPIDTIESPMHVECGSDFTIVMSTDYTVKAFGGNSNGQCGRDLGASLDKNKQRVLCLPTTKRLMRFESQCVDMPVEINLPRPRLLLNNEPVRYLKIIPQYKAEYLQEAFINLEAKDGDFNVFGAFPTSSQHYKSTTTQNTSSDFVLTGQEASDDLISSLENLSTNDLGSLPHNSNYPSLLQHNETESLEGNSNSEKDVRQDSEQQSYQPLLSEANNENKESSEEKADPANASGNNNNNNQAANGESPSEQNTISSSEAESSSKEQIDPRLIPHIQNIRRNIHYILYIFHGLYDPDKIKDFSQHRYEYRLRVLMLNFKFIEAFVLALEACPNAQHSLRLFEYFTKDTGYVPLRKQDLKYFIYYLLKHFLKHKLDLMECERFLLADLDYYLLELAYVLYFNNNNTVLEQNLNQKFKDLLGQDDNNLMNNNSVQTIVAAATAASNNLRNNLNFNQNQQQLSQNEDQHKFEDTDVIFDSLSVKFKTIVCQRLLKYVNN